MLDTYNSSDFARTASNSLAKCAVKRVNTSPYDERQWCIQVSYDKNGRALAVVGKLSQKRNGLRMHIDL